MSSSSRPLPKRAIHRLFALFGLRVARISATLPKGAEKYFNTGGLSPFEENSIGLYDSFYSDHGSVEEYYDAQRLSFYSAVSDFLQSESVALDGTDVLDAGCGTGHMLSELLRWSTPRSVSGCDFSQAAIDFSRDRFPKFHFFRHDVYDALPTQFDVVICTEVLEHLEHPWDALTNLGAALRDGGVMVLTVPNGRLDNSNEHINFWSPESWKAFLTMQAPGCLVATALLGSGGYNIAILRKRGGDQERMSGVRQ